MSLMPRNSTEKRFGGIRLLGLAEGADGAVDTPLSLELACTDTHTLAWLRACYGTEGCVRG
eukprot:COSAG02_NODE_19646_length_870_cov_1.695596_1_plen_61_part_00